MVPSYDYVVHNGGAPLGKILESIFIFLHLLRQEGGSRGKKLFFSSLAVLCLIELSL